MFAIVADGLPGTLICEGTYIKPNRPVTTVIS